MAGTLTPTPFQTVLDATGIAVSGAKIYTYTAGTTTAAATYTTLALDVANANPIVADSSGRYVAYLPAGGNFKFTFKTSGDVLIKEQDNIQAVPGSSVNLDITGTVGEAVTAGQVVYMSSGGESSPLTKGLWYLTDSDATATSTLPQSVGMAISAIAINTAGTIRLAGEATTAGSVVVGSTYYVGATPGAIVASAPSNVRTVGVANTTSTLILSATSAVVATIPVPITQDLLFTDNTYDIGKSGATRPRDGFFSRNTVVGGTLGVTGIATLTAQPILSSLTASRSVFTDGSKGLVSNAITGTGNVVMSASPTLTGTIGAAAMTLSTPLPVASGGTGIAAITANTVMLGAGTSDVTLLAPGTSGNVMTSNGTVWSSTAPAAAETGLVVEGRLTLTSGTPVTTADVTGATNIYFTPYAGNRIALYDGSSGWNVRTFTEITIAVGTIDAAKPYDLFAYDNSGTVTFDAPLAWTNSTTRATALTTQNGVLVKTGATTRRYIGTFYTTATTTTEDSFAKRFLWNYYNRVNRPMRVIETANTWTYTTATFRQANANAANQLDIVVGWAEVEFNGYAVGLPSNNAAVATVTTGIGEDSTSAAATGCLLQSGQTQVNNRTVMSTATLRTFPAVGRHYYVWLEKSAATNTTTWFGDDGDATTAQTGIMGSIEG